MIGVERLPVDVTVIVVSWNTQALLANCLESIRAHPAPGVVTRVVVVDNGSTDGSVEMVRTDWPGVAVIANNDNLGFTKANNQAIRASSSEFVLLLNSDAELTGGCLERLLQRMRTDSTIGAVGARLIFRDGRSQRWAAGQTPSLRTAVNHYFFLDHVFERLPIFAGLYLQRDDQRARPIDWVCGACMLLRRAPVEAVGLLDESFFMYMEDVDVCLRLRARGWSTWYVPDAVALHLVSQSLQGAPLSVKVQAVDNFNRVFESLHGRRQLKILRRIQTIAYGIRGLAYLIAAAATRSPGLAQRSRENFAYMKPAGLTEVAPPRAGPIAPHEVRT